MIVLVRNEWKKMRREWALWFALALHLAPLAMVAVAALMGAIDSGPQRYFILHNQSMLVTGLVACVVTSLAFHVEISNRTWFEWLTQQQGVARLVAAKLVVVALILAVFVALSTVLTVALMAASGVSAELGRMVLAYLCFQAGTLGIMLVFSALICVLSRNVVVVNIVGVAVGMVTMVVMAADFSWAIPTAWAYRMGLVIFDPETGLSSPIALPMGGILFFACTVVMLWVTLMWARRPSVINAVSR